MSRFKKKRPQYGGENSSKYKGLGALIGIRSNDTQGWNQTNQENHIQYKVFCNPEVLKTLSGASLLPQYTFLIQFLFKVDENPLGALSPPPVHTPYSILIQN